MFMGDMLDVAVRYCARGLVILKIDYWDYCFLAHLFLKKVFYDLFLFLRFGKYFHFCFLIHFWFLGFSFAYFVFMFL